MNIRGILLSILGVTVLSFVMDFVIHGIMMADLYVATADLWRPMDEMGPLKSVVSDLIFAVLFVLFYVFIVTNKTLKNGIKFGFGYGVIGGFVMMSLMNYMPIPATIAVSWFFACLVKSILFGALVGYLTKEPKTESA